MQNVSHLHERGFMGIILSIRMARGYGVIPRAHSVHGKSRVATSFGIFGATLNTISSVIWYFMSL